MLGTVDIETDRTATSGQQESKNWRSPVIK